MKEKERVTVDQLSSMLSKLINDTPTRPEASAETLERVNIIKRHDPDLFDKAWDMLFGDEADE